MACTCLAATNVLFADRGQYIKVTLGSLFGGVDRPVIELYRKDTDAKENRRSKSKFIVPNFCPFCGISYDAKRPEVCEAVGSTIADLQGQAGRGPVLEAIADLATEVFRVAGGGPAPALAGGDPGPEGAPPADDRRDPVDGGPA